MAAPARTKIEVLISNSSDIQDPGTVRISIDNDDEDDAGMMKVLNQRGSQQNKHEQTEVK